MATELPGSAATEDRALLSLAWWVAAGVALFLLVTFLWRSLRMQQRAEQSGHAALQYTVALRSALIYVAMALPPLLMKCTEEEAGKMALHSWGACTASPYGILPTNLMRVYHWLPFWFAAMVCTHLGVAISNACDAIAGTVVGLLAVSFLNSLTPGGAGGKHRNIPEAAHGWLPGGYSTPVMLLIVYVLVYLLLISRMSIGKKQYALGLFASSVVPFMNPATARGFRAVLFDSNWEWNWNGPIMSEAWVLVAAIVLSFLSLGLIPCSRRSFERHTCLGCATKALSELAQDTLGCWEWTVAGTLTGNPHNFDVDSAFHFVKQLGARRTAVESLLGPAPWECFTAQNRTRLARLWHLCSLLRNLRQALRAALLLARGQGLPVTQEAQVLVDEYLAACRESLQVLIAACCDGHALQGECDEAVSAAGRADAALARALELVEDCPYRLACLDLLRTWPACVHKAAEELRGEVSVQVPQSTAPEQDFVARHWYAERNRLSWMLAFLWSLYFRRFTAGCVSTVSYIYPTTSGSSFDKNINRMVGVGLGLGIGSVPALLVMQQTSLDGGESQVFLQGLTIYLVVMFIMWAVVMYGYLAPGSKYSYACLLWVGFSGTQMLRNVPKYDPARGLFLDILDNMLACLIVFVVDLLWSYSSGQGTSGQAKTAVARCVEACAELAGADDLCEVDILAVQDLIKNARFWHSEIRQEGLVWTTFWETPYKAELARMLLDNCDSVSVAVLALQASAPRCREPGLVKEIVRTALGGRLAQRSGQSAKCVRAVLDGNFCSDSLTELFAGPAETESGKPWEATPSPSAGETSSERAAALAVRAGACALRDSLQRISLLLAARAALDGREWRAGFRDSSPLCNGKETTPLPGDKPHALEAELRRRQT